MQIHVGLIALFALAPSQVGAQSTTVDGVRALVRGDIQAAVQILTPLAGQADSTDPLAQFFLAMSYQAGPGIAKNAYACRLYLRAAVPANPLARQSWSLAAALQRQFASAPSLCVGATAPPSDSLPPAPATSSATQPQTPTGEGVEAFVRGDYQRAAEILRPMADSIALPYDSVAGFFMASMYDSGRGIEADAMRACALYVRASAILPIPPPAAPFVTAAEAMRSTIWQSMSKETLEQCRLTAVVGFEHRFEPITFVLEPNHWIAFALNGVTITYRGRDTVASRGLMSPGNVYLPIRHTALHVGPTHSIRRDFIEVAAWTSGAGAQQWTLAWHLFEVVRNELISVAIQWPVTVSSSEPPAAGSFDLADIVHLRVTDTGRAEWVLSGGSMARSEMIPTDEERREAGREASEHKAREARIDWGRAFDPQRMPALRYPDADGCGHTVVYGWSDDRAEAISIQADARALNLSTTPRTFDLSGGTPGLEVLLHVYERAVRESPMCTDVRLAGNRVQPWRATHGTITIELLGPDQDPTGRNRPRAIVHIVGAEFIDGTGQRVRQQAPIVITAMVGSVSG